MKQQGRILWAVAMTAATVTTISGYTLAVSRQPMPELPPAVTLETVAEPLPSEPLLVVLRLNVRFFSGVLMAISLARSSLTDAGSAFSSLESGQFLSPHLR